MSSEDINNLIGLGNAFDGDSPGPSSPVDEQSPVFSWTESSRDNPISQKYEVATRGGQDNGEANSSGRERWNCVDLISIISMRDASRISKKYNVEVGFREETGRPHNPHAGHVTVLETFLKFDL